MQAKGNLLMTRVVDGNRTLTSASRPAESVFNVAGMRKVRGKHMAPPQYTRRYTCITINAVSQMTFAGRGS